MKTIRIDPTFEAWRSAARALLADKVHPREVLWGERGGEDDGLLVFDEPPQIKPGSVRLKVPREFVRLAETVSCHRSGKQWALLYEVLWAITFQQERGILQNQTDSSVRALAQMRKTVCRDIHKMRAFVRFRQVADGENGRESYVSWYEPEHLIVRLNTAFFRKRFGGMNWSILTPDECVHWNGEQISYTAGVDRAAAPEGDELEELWLGYYRSIFNPARIKIKMMQSEMPKKYWKNLPEAEVIEELIKNSTEQVLGMMEEQQRPLKAKPENAYLKSLERLPTEDKHRLEH